MFSSKYYLSKLIDNSLSLSKIEKINIFNFATKNTDKISDFITILEDDKKGWDFIKSNYQKKVNLIGENFKNDLKNGIENEKIKHTNKIKDRINL
ncbi:MAG: hypothetical protein Q9M94_01140 [Candidatus Gracilibacteria bacterium]|nr:hypothetical protein [Candidatus Gracilibacteria bacterium]